MAATSSPVEAQRPQRPTQPAIRQAPPEATPSATQRLMTARQALVEGRPEEAQRLLETAQLQMVLRPIDPDDQAAPSINMPATWVGRAIRSLQNGDSSGALHDLDLAINSS
jgi:hypothetical protein